MADALLALEAVLPTGEVFRSPPAPGGGDLFRLFLGSEGTLGIVTEATLRMWPVPDVRAWAAFTLAGFGKGLDAVRFLYRTDARPAVVRLLDPAAAAGWQASHGLPAGEALLLLAFEGDELVQTGQYQMAHAVCQKMGGTERAPEIGEAWFDQRFQTGWMAPNARPGGLADAFAFSAPWSKVSRLYEDVRAALAPLVTSLHVHSGHACPAGAALDFVFQAQADPAAPEAALALYERIVAASTAACLAAGGSLAHHYGVGIALRRYVPPEQTALLRRIKAALDPNNIMNPGKGGGNR